MPVGIVFDSTPLPCRYLFNIFSLGLPCLGQYSVDNCWYRGLVIEANEGIKQATVLYVDYGNFEEVTFDRSV